MALIAKALPPKPLFVTRSPYLAEPKPKPTRPAPPKRAHSYGGLDYQTCLAEFEVVGPIAQGAFSQVLRAKRVADEREQVAIKCFNLKRMADSPDEKRAMLRELAALAALSHPNVMRLHASVEGNNSTHYAIMEYLGGSSLKYELSKRSAAFPEPVACALLAQLAGALAHVHARGYIHRDVKAANVLFSDASHTRVKLVDFGFAMPFVEGSTRALPKCGTPTHMAPELHLLRTYDGRRADVWALGVLCYELLHRALPFDAPNLEALKMRIIKGHRAPTAKGLSLGARALVNQMLTVDPAERPDAAQVCAHPWLALQTMPSADLVAHSDDAGA